VFLANCQITAIAFGEVKGKVAIAAWDGKAEGDLFLR